MFSLAFLIGLYANCIFLLGMAHFLTKPILIVFSTLYILCSVLFWNRFDKKVNWAGIKKEVLDNFNKHTLWVVGLISAFSIMVLGSLVPETAFDALWYHLTLPKLYLAMGGISFIPGSLFYYSAMPKLGEMLYIPAIALQGDILAHSIHLAFAVLTGIAIYELIKKFSSPYFAIIGVVIFFSNIVVLWEATTAYVDLIRAFYEVMALWGIINYIEKKEIKWLVESAFLFGLAVETKLLAMMSLPIFVTALFFFGFKRRTERLFDCILFIFLSLLVSLGWFALSYSTTGNPLYPLFGNYSVVIGKDVLAFPQTITDMATVFVSSADPISPIYLMLVPLLLLVWRKLGRQEVMLVILSLVSLLMWTVTPKTGGGRFILPYLPLFSLTAGVVLSKLKNEKQLLKISLGSILLVFIVSIAYRGVAQMRTLPVVLGVESRESYLTKSLNFQFGDFYDTDNKIKDMVGPSKKVLLYGFHNLYYLDVPFIDSSYVQRGDTFDFVATQHADLPKRFSYWQPIYYNKTTGVTLYTLGQEWVY